MPALFFFSGFFGRDASWNATDVIVASGTPFAWLWMLTVSSNSTICLHGSQLGFVSLLTLIGCHANISWSWKKPSASLTMQKGCRRNDDISCVRARIRSKRAAEEKKKEKNSEVPALFFSAALLDRMRARTQLMSSLRRASLLHGYGC